MRARLDGREDRVAEGEGHDPEHREPRVVGALRALVAEAVVRAHRAHLDL